MIFNLSNHSFIEPPSWLLMIYHHPALFWKAKENREGPAGCRRDAQERRCPAHCQQRATLRCICRFWNYRKGCLQTGRQGAERCHQEHLRTDYRRTNWQMKFRTILSQPPRMKMITRELSISFIIRYVTISNLKSRRLAEDLDIITEDE